MVFLNKSIIEIQNYLYPFNLILYCTLKNTHSHLHSSLPCAMYYVIVQLECSIRWGKKKKKFSHSVSFSHVQWSFLFNFLCILHYDFINILFSFALTVVSMIHIQNKVEKKVRVCLSLFIRINIHVYFIFIYSFEHSSNRNGIQFNLI